MMRAGWRYILHAAPTVQTAVDLVPQAAHSGRFGVRLAVAPLEAEQSARGDRKPADPVHQSRRCRSRPGRSSASTAGCRFPPTSPASTDGLLVVDSFSGEALADRIGKTNGWRQFALYRVAPQSGPMCVTFALSGIGEAWLDDVAIQVLEDPAADDATLTAIP